jgi:hypothetical protein
VRGTPWIPLAALSMLLACGSERPQPAPDSPGTQRVGAPDAGPFETCCAGGCNGDTCVRAVCDAGACTCPPGSVSPADCIGYPGQYCGGAQPPPLDGPDAGP